MKKYLIISTICALGVVSPNSYAMDAQFRENHNNISEQKKTILPSSSVVKHAEKSNPLIKGLRKVGSFAKKHKIACSVPLVAAFAAIRRGTEVGKRVIDPMMQATAAALIAEVIFSVELGRILVGEFRNILEEPLKRHPVISAIWPLGVVLGFYAVNAQFRENHNSVSVKHAENQNPLIKGLRKVGSFAKKHKIACSVALVSVLAGVDKRIIDLTETGINTFVRKFLPKIGKKFPGLWKNLTKSHIEKMCKGDPCGVNGSGYLVGKDCVARSSMLGAVTCGSEMSFKQHENLVKDLVERTCAFFQKGLIKSPYNYILGRVKCPEIDSDRAKDIVETVMEEACLSSKKLGTSSWVGTINYLYGNPIARCDV